MYEVWLMLNIVFEIVLDALGTVLVILLAWLVLMTLARQRLRTETIRSSLVIGVVATVVLGAVLPAVLASSFADMGYWVDWANLLGVAGAGGAIITAFAWPVLSLVRRPASIYD